MITEKIKPTSIKRISTEYDYSAIDKILSKLTAGSSVKLTFDPNKTNERFVMSALRSHVESAFPAADIKKWHLGRSGAKDVTIDGKNYLSSVAIYAEAAAAATRKSKNGKNGKNAAAATATAADATTSA